MSEPFRMNIGEVLRRAGKVTQGDIDDAVTLMGIRGNLKLGEALVEIGACKMQDVIVALDRQKRMATDEGDTVGAMAEVVDDAAAVIRKAADTIVVACLSVALTA